MKTEPMQFEQFATWEDVLDHVCKAGTIYYRPPMNIRPLLLRAEVKSSRRIRIIPDRHDGDPFNADRGHFDRFFQPTKDAPLSEPRDWRAEDGR